MKTSADILIVGAGPTGLATAAALQKAGLAPLVIDASATPAHTSRAAVVHARTLEVLEDLGVTDDLLRQGVKVPWFRVRDRDRVLLDIDFSTLPSPYPFTLMCPQDRTEAVLLARFEALGGSVRRGVRATGLQVGAGSTRVTFEGDGPPVSIEARYVIGADGSHSAVREGAGIAFEGGTYAQSFVLADVRLDWPLPPQEVSLFFSEQGLVVVAPLPDDRFRIVATVAEAPEQPDLRFMQALLDARGPATRPGAIREVIWSSRFLVHHKVAATFRKGAVFLAGDAAHVHSPAGGQGMNTGIQDGLELAAAIGEHMLSGREAPLSAYADRRRRIALGIVSLTDRITRAATVRSPAGRQLRNVALGLVGQVGPVRRAIARNLAELERS